MLKRRLAVSLLWRKIGIVQSRGFSHTNVVGDPKVAIECFNAWDADEIILLNVERDDRTVGDFLKLVSYVSKHCFLPLTVGGWIRDVERARLMVESGADKIAVNTAAVDRPGLYSEIAHRLGSQCLVASLDVRGDMTTGYEVAVDRGSRSTGLQPAEAARRAVAAGAGEILLTSIDRDGSAGGYDLDLVRTVVRAVSVPLIVFGGVGRWEHLGEGIDAGAEAVAAGNIFHFTEQSTRKAKLYLRSAGYPVR